MATKTQRALKLVHAELSDQRTMLEEILRCVKSHDRQDQEAARILRDHSDRIPRLEVAVKELLGTGTAG